MESSICLIRHGITEGNKNRLYYGFSDVPLADEGIDELTKLAQAGIYPYDEEADFYTTGLKRTEQTLSLIYG
ncbi:MAG: phosphoglycerate mutase family protein, partial [Anaerovoracaceae bacterium]